jgi:hypothetical protein
MHLALRRTIRWTVGILIVAGMLVVVVGVSHQARPDTSAAPAGSSGASRVEPITGTDLHRVILTAESSKRLGIQVVPVNTAPQPYGQETVVPYAAVQYDVNGDTWAYTSPESLVFVRHRISVDTIAGDLAVLSSGPPLGTLVVTVGTPELFGIEFNFGSGE